jgi:drug/metabolite transporter (DMT)-like permease
MVIAGVIVSILGLSTEHVNWSIAFAPQSIADVGYLAVFGSGIAFFCNLWALQRLPAGIVGLTTLIIPVIAVGAGVAFGGEHFTAREAYGSIGVVTGVTIALWQRREKPRTLAAKCAA